MVAEGQYSMAVEALDMALQCSPDIPRILFLRSVAYRRLHRFQDALADLRMVVVGKDAHLE